MVPHTEKNDNKSTSHLPDLLTIICFIFNSHALLLYNQKRAPLTICFEAASSTRIPNTELPSHFQLVSRTETSHSISICPGTSTQFAVAIDKMSHNFSSRSVEQTKCSEQPKKQEPTKMSMMEVKPPPRPYTVSKQEFYVSLYGCYCFEPESHFIHIRYLLVNYRSTISSFKSKGSTSYKTLVWSLPWNLARHFQLQIQTTTALSFHRGIKELPFQQIGTFLGRHAARRGSTGQVTEKSGTMIMKSFVSTKLYLRLCHLTKNAKLLRYLQLHWSLEGYRIFMEKYWWRNKTLLCPTIRSVLRKAYNAVLIRCTLWFLKKDGVHISHLWLLFYTIYRYWNAEV